MDSTGAISLAVGVLALGGVLLTNRTQRRIAQEAATRKQEADQEAAERKRQDALTAEQEKVTAEQIRADDAAEARLSDNIWEYVRQLRDRCDAQDRRCEAMERRLEEKDRRIDALDDLTADLKADLTQARITALQAQAENTTLRAKAADLTAENTQLRAEVARLHARVDELEQRQNAGPTIQATGMGAP